jgi:nicotinamidase/pyrazinamidase
MEEKTYHDKGQNRSGTIFWDEDTQFDFMNPEGKLYVPGAVDIIDKVSEIREFAINSGYSIIASCDWHSLTDSEISQTPDNINTYPPHCMINEPGAERVGSLGKIKPANIELTPMKLDYLKKLVSPDQFHIVIRKKTIDVFSNPNASVLLGLVRPVRVFIFGVALDVCVDMSVKGLLERNIRDVTILSDAVKGLGIKPDDEVYNDLAKKGVKIRSFDTVRSSLLRSGAKAKAGHSR